MSNKVQLYVYDLSNGLARSLSRQLTGRQIDGIWHTSVVVFGKEIFYGQGICTTAPGQSHHGSPLQVLDMGETSIDEETFQEYLEEMRQHYTADKYHLLEFNCNSFTNDCIGFLTGGSIPAWIKDLPSDFLSTPFGAALRPTIDAMFRRPVSGVTPTPATFRPSPEAASAAAAASPNPALASQLLQAVASQAFSPTTTSTSPSVPPTHATDTISAPIHMCTNPAAFHGLLRSHRAVVAFFTSATCAPCRMIEPVFEELAHEKTNAEGNTKIAFVKIDMGAGLGFQVGGEWGVRATPTFLFFLDGQKVADMQGANAPELRSQTNILIFQAFPPHPHTTLSLPAIEALSTKPILFTQVPALDAVNTKLLSFIDASAPAAETQAVKHILTSSVFPYLKESTDSGNQAKKPAGPQLLASWAGATRILANSMPPNQLFPLVDMWRLALLDSTVATWCANVGTNAASNVSDPIAILLNKGIQVIEASDPGVKAAGRSYLLTLLRLLANGFAHPIFAGTLLSQLSSKGKRDETTKVLVASLLHEDAAVRTAAASLAFNIAAFLQKSRVDKVRGASASNNTEQDEDWEVELVSAVLEALANETQSEDVVHRLTAALAFLLRLSPVYETQLVPLMEVLQARDTLKRKLEKGGCGAEGVQKKEVRSLVDEVASKLCP